MLHLTYKNLYEIVTINIICIVFDSNTKTSKRIDLSILINSKENLLTLKDKAINELFIFGLISEDEKSLYQLQLGFEFLDLNENIYNKLVKNNQYSSLLLIRKFTYN